MRKPGDEPRMSNLLSTTRLLIIFSLLLILSGVTIVSAPALRLPMTFTLNEIKKLNARGWGPAEKEHDRTFRLALKNQEAWLRIPRWWGNSIRPPKGARYIIEVTYQDTATQPIVAEVFGAFVSNYDFPNGGTSRLVQEGTRNDLPYPAYYTRGEIHRFGGTGDGRWKVAYVPASWDTLISPQGSEDAEIGFRTSADLPIAQIKVREAKLPEDQARYEKESREWVAKVEEPKAINAVSATKDQTPVIPSLDREKSFVPYVRPYYDHIFPNSAPQAGEAEATINIRMARNEYEPGSFAVYAQKDLDNVNYTVSELMNSQGEKLNCEIKPYTAEYALVRQSEQANDTKPLIWEPQRLWPAYDVSIRKNQSGWFYLTLHTLGRESRPGKYTGKVTVTAGKETAVIPLSVEVLPISLLTMDEAGLRMGGCSWGLPPAGDLKTMLEHNHNMSNIWYQGVRPQMTRVGNTFKLDFYYIDDWMKLAKENGQKTILWYLGGDPNGYPETLPLEIDLFTLMNEGGREAYFRKTTTPEGRRLMLPEIREHYKEWIRQVVAHAKEKNWPELIFAPFDEPAKWAYPEPRIAPGRKYAIGCGPWIRDHFKDSCALIHEAVPGVKVYVSIHNNYEANVNEYQGRIGEIYIPDVDIVSTNAIKEDPQLGIKAERAGKEFWQYAGTRSARYGFGFWFASWDSVGSLCWAYNWGDRLDITEGGNYQYAWYSPFETILTPAYEEIREGWDDRRYMETAKAAARKAGKDINPLLKEIRHEVMENQGKGGRNFEIDFWDEPKNKAKMDKWRAMLADQMMELTRPTAQANPSSALQTKSKKVKRG